MCTVLLLPGVKPIAANKYITYYIITSNNVIGAVIFNNLETKFKQLPSFN